MGNCHSTWCPGSGKGVDAEEIDLKRRRITSSGYYLGPNVYEDVTPMTTTLESDYLTKSTEHGFISSLQAGKSKKRNRAGSFEIVQVPEDFHAENLCARRVKSSTCSNRASRAQSNGTEMPPAATS